MRFSIQKIEARWRELLRKRRLSIQNAIDRTEEWHIHLSPASIIAASVSFVLLLFILILTLVAYTPVLEFLPGYRTDAERSRENLVQNIIRLDSMERVLNDMMTYNQNIALIMDGKSPVARTYTSSADTARAMKVLVMPSREDSLLRAQMEGTGIYSLAPREGDSRRQAREALELVTPVEGIITDRFDLKKGRFGARISAAPSARITAIDNGTVIQSLWTPEQGHTVILQHGTNLISVYKNLSQSLVTAGQTVRSGDLIGYNAEADKEQVKLFEFELWSNGKPVDPEGYIVF